MESSSGSCYYGEGDLGPKLKWAKTKTYLISISDLHPFWAGRKC